MVWCWSSSAAGAGIDEGAADDDAADELRRCAPAISVHRGQFAPLTVRTPPQDLTRRHGLVARPRQRADARPDGGDQEADGEGEQEPELDGEFLGVLGPRWVTDSIFNDSSKYSSSWSSESIFNTHSNYGNSYSSESVFNDSASNPPRIISEEGEEIGKLSIGPSWDNTRYNPYDIKYTCDWD